MSDNRDQGRVEFSIVDGPTHAGHFSTAWSKGEIVHLTIQQDASSREISVKVYSLSRPRDESTLVPVSVEFSGYIWGGDCEQWMRSQEFEAIYSTQSRKGKMLIKKPE